MCSVPIFLILVVVTDEVDADGRDEDYETSLAIPAVVMVWWCCFMSQVGLADHNMVGGPHVGRSRFCVDRLAAPRAEAYEDLRHFAAVNGVASGSARCAIKPCCARSPVEGGDQVIAVPSCAPGGQRRGTGAYTDTAKDHWPLRRNS